ncbi:transposase [Aeromonas schubertii]|uniref:Transposase n=1 Tax=Aeromonas schubertii TaxID=652 RepID=A0A0S2SFQ9_9GAMM|nr:transposase [Aeromonas schubertii]
MWQDFQHTLISLFRVGDILDTSAEAGNDGLASMTAISGEVKFRNVRFRYDDAAPEVLRGLNLNIRSGEFIGALMEWSPLPKTASECQSGECKFPLMREATTMKTAAIGIDLAKHLFQLHGVDQHGKTVLKRQLKREQMLSFFSNLPPSLIGMEACSSAHYWANKLQGLGHTVKLMAPQFVKPYVVMTPIS